PFELRWAGGLLFGCGRDGGDDLLWSVSGVEGVERKSGAPEPASPAALAGIGADRHLARAARGVWRTGEEPRQFALATIGLRATTLAARIHGRRRLPDSGRLQPR